MHRLLQVILSPTFLANGIVYTKNHPHRGGGGGGWSPFGLLELTSSQLWPFGDGSADNDPNQDKAMSVLPPPPPEDMMGSDVGSDVSSSSAGWEQLWHHPADTQNVQGSYENSNDFRNKHYTPYNRYKCQKFGTNCRKDEENLYGKLHDLPKSTGLAPSWDGEYPADKYSSEEDFLDSFDGDQDSSVRNSFAGAIKYKDPIPESHNAKQKPRHKSRRGGGGLRGLISGLFR